LEGAAHLGSEFDLGRAAPHSGGRRPSTLFFGLLPARRLPSAAPGGVQRRRYGLLVGLCLAKLRLGGLKLLAAVKFLDVAADRLSALSLQHRHGSSPPVLFENPPAVRQQKMAESRLAV